MVSRYSGEHLRTNFIENFFIEAFEYEKYEIYWKLSKNDNF